MPLSWISTIYNYSKYSLLYPQICVASTPHQRNFYRIKNTKWNDNEFTHLKTWVNIKYSSLKVLPTPSNFTFIYFTFSQSWNFRLISGVGAEIRQCSEWMDRGLIGLDWWGIGRADPLEQMKEQELPNHQANDVSWTSYMISSVASSMGRSIKPSSAR